MLFPKLDDQLPQRGNRFTKWCGRVLMRLCRWHIEGEIYQSRKVLFVMAPHTSWWDFITNFGVLLTLGLHASWFIADKFIKGVVGNFLLYIGAVPVDRSKQHGMVTQMVKEFHTRDRFLLAIFPEGTRKPVPKWKSGFWHIAKEAGVPVQLIGVDYVKRATIFGPVLTLSDDMEKDIADMRAFFKQVIPKHPENALY